MIQASQIERKTKYPKGIGYEVTILTVQSF